MQNIRIKQQKPFSNYHTHSHYCDGVGELEDYVLKAISLEMPALGFSGHGPVPFESWWNMTDVNFKIYLDEISKLKLEYKNQIQIYAGLEADWLENVINFKNFDNFNLDYKIGAIHFLRAKDFEENWDFIISPEVFKKGLEKFYKNDIKKLIEDYYYQMNLLIEQKPDVIAHIDQVLKFNKGNIYFDENHAFYKNIITETIKLAAKNNVIIEVNTRGKLKNLRTDFYPSNLFLEICKQHNVKITISADAHQPEELNSFLNDAAQNLIDLGFKEIFMLYNKLWQPVEFTNKGVFL